MYYFPKRRMGVMHMWPKTSVIVIKELYEIGDEESVGRARSMEEDILYTVRNKKPVLFIDMSDNGLTNFIYKPTPLVKKYVDENYNYFNTVNKMKFYIRRDYKPVQQR
jgi:hypothetical protein